MQISSKDPDVAFAAVSALGNIGDLHAVAPLAELLKTSKDGFVKSACVRSLYRLNDASAIDAMLSRSGYPIDMPKPRLTEIGKKTELIILLKYFYAVDAEKNPKFIHLLEKLKKEDVQKKLQEIEAAFTKSLG